MSVDQIELELSRLPQEEQDRIAAHLMQLRGQRVNQATYHPMTKREKLWADLSSHEDDIEVPDWHLTVLTETEAEIEAGKVNFVPWNQAKESIVRQLK
jgi:hypothetical protein